MSVNASVIPLTVGPQDIAQNCIVDWSNQVYGRTYTTNCLQQYQERLTVDAVLTSLTAEELVRLQKAIPGELTKRISALEKSAEEANRVLELARQAVGEVKP